jgi:hypothetical protein
MTEVNGTDPGTVVDVDGAVDVVTVNGCES